MTGGVDRRFPGRLWERCIFQHSPSRGAVSEETDAMQRLTVVVSHINPGSGFCMIHTQLDDFQQRRRIQRAGNRRQFGRLLCGQGHAAVRRRAATHLLVQSSLPGRLAGCMQYSLTRLRVRNRRSPTPPDSVRGLPQVVNNAMFPEIRPGNGVTTVHRKGAEPGRALQVHLAGRFGKRSVQQADQSSRQDQAPGLMPNFEHAQVQSIMSTSIGGHQRPGIGHRRTGSACASVGGPLAALFNVP